MKKILVLTVATAFILSMTSFCLADNVPWRGKVFQVCPDSVTIIDNTGTNRIICISGATELNYGDMVMVKNGAGKQRAIIKGGSKHVIDGIECQPKPVGYKDGEDGVNRTHPGESSPCPNVKDVH